MIAFFWSLWIPGAVLVGNWQTDTLRIVPGDTVLQLSRSLIVPQTLTAEILDGAEINSDSLQVDALKGTMTLIRPVTDTCRAVLRYRYLALEIPRRSILNPLPCLYLPDQPASSPGSDDVQIRAPASNIPGDYDFLRSGTIYRGLTIGSQSGLSLQSGLNLELKGDISEDIAVVGSLTDQNIPIQPEGNTQTLDEVDKVFIRVDMPREELTFGDYEVHFRDKGLANYSRKLQGIRLDSRRRIGETTLGGAVTKGRYHSNFFRGEESNQGPYQLYGKEGESAIIILAGTEKVWIDGETMQRGENNDYTIDYSTAELTFTPGRLITADSRITVDFQYSNLVYQKNIYLARQTADFFDDRWHLEAGFINENDDRDNPIELTIDADDRERLKQIGDQQSLGFISSIREDTAGVYILQDSILIFKGTGQGTHSATFYNVGNTGCYKKVYDPNGVYFEWVDRDDPTISPAEIEQAVYLPVKPLKLPRRQQLYHFNSRAKLSDRLTMSTDLAVSNTDQNTFSPIDDEDNQGAASDIRVDYASPEFRNNRLEIGGHYRRRERRFRPIDRFEAVEYHRKWDLPTTTPQGEEVLEGSFQYRHRDLLNFTLDGGYLSQPNFESERYRIGGAFRYRWLERLELWQEEIESQAQHNPQSRWRRQKLMTRVAIRKLRPYASLYRERRIDPRDSVASFRFLEQRYGIDLQGIAKLKTNIELFWRHDEHLEAAQWRSRARARNIRWQGQLSDWHALFLRWTYTIRNKTYLGPRSQPDADIQLLDLMVRHNPRQWPFRWEAVLKVEEEKTVKKEQRYFFVGQGEGDFIYDSTFADYVSHPQGDYILRVMPTAIKEPVTGIQHGIRLHFSGHSLPDRLREAWIGRLTTLTDIRLQQQIRAAANPFRTMTFMPSQVNDQWAYFNRILQQDVTYRLKNRRGNLRYRYLNSERLSQLDVRGFEEKSSLENSLRYRGFFIGSLRLDSELGHRHLARESAFNTLRDRDINSVVTKNTFSYLHDQIHLISSEITLNYDTQTLQNTIAARLIGIKNSYERKFKSSGRINCFLEFDRVTVMPEGSRIPWEMSNGKKEGLTVGWGFSLEYRIGKNLTIRANYQGWNEPERDLYHLGGGEVRAIF